MIHGKYELLMSFVLSSFGLTTFFLLPSGLHTHISISGQDCHLRSEVSLTIRVSIPCTHAALTSFTCTYMHSTIQCYMSLVYKQQPLYTIRCTQLSPHPVCWDLLPSPAVAAQSYGGLPHWPYGEQSAPGTVIDIRIGNHRY